MSEICINFDADGSIISGVTAEAKRVKNRIGDINREYERISGKMDKLGGNNLCTANTYIRKKRAALEEKEQAINDFKNGFVNFNSSAQNTERAVKWGIKANYWGFKAKKIRAGVVNALCTIAQVVSDGWRWLKKIAFTPLPVLLVISGKKLYERIKEFYEKHKYIVDLVVDAVALAAALAGVIAAAATGVGIPVALAGLWGLIKAGASFGFSLKAYQAHKAGFDNIAEQYSGKGMKDILQSALGTKLGSLVYHGLNIAAFAVTVGSTIKDVKYFKSTQGVAAKYGDMLTPATISGIEDNGRKTIIKVITGLDFTKVSGKSVLKNSSSILKFVSTLGAKGQIAGVLGIGILKDMSGVIKDLISIINPQRASALPY